MAKDGLRFLGDPSHPISCDCNILDKSQSRFEYVQYMLDRTNRMFTYTNLPDTIPEFMLEYMLQCYGSVAIIQHKDSLYAIRCEFGGPQDPYYRPTQAVVANPALDITKTYKIINHLPPFEKTVWEGMPPCIRFYNDTQIQGLIPLFSRYAAQMTENDISIRSAQINSRQQSIIAADSGVEIESAQKYIDALERGELATIEKRAMMDGVQVINASSGASSVITQLIELQQYLRASWYNEVGLSSNYNMKRTYISSDEIDSTSDIMLPLIDNMFECRKQAVDLINKHFGTNITVSKDSAWEIKEKLENALVNQTENQDFTSEDEHDQNPESEQETENKDKEEGEKDDSEQSDTSD